MESLEKPDDGDSGLVGYVDARPMTGRVLSIAA